MMAIFGAILPRFILLVGWSNDPTYWESLFGSSLWLLGGFLFLPWTTLAWAVCYAPIRGVTGFGWFVVGIAFVADIMTYVSGHEARQQRRATY